MHSDFSILEQIIERRRTTKPDKMNGHIIPDEQVNALLHLAHWAPNHGGTEPWHFFVYTGESLQRFCMEHADMYRTHTPSDRFTEQQYEKLLTMGSLASHLVIAVMKRGELAKIPKWEEMAATATAVQHILLGATAIGIASYWGTGGMIQHQAMKDYLQLGTDDFVMGAVYLGYTSEHKEGKRKSAIDDKISWV